MPDEPKPPVIIAAFPSPTEPEMVDFFSTLGNAVNRWAYVDRQLFRLFRFGMRMDNRQAAVIYYEERAFNRRLARVGTVLKSILPIERYSEWKALAKELNGLSHIRNVFAHHPAKRYGTSDGTKPVYIWSVHIEPYERLLNRDYAGLEDKEELFTEDLVKHISDVEATEEKLRKFYALLWADAKSGS